MAIDSSHRVKAANEFGIHFRNDASDKATGSAAFEFYLDNDRKIHQGTKRE